MAHTTANTSLLRRTELWSAELKELLRDDLMAMGFVDVIGEFPDGDTFTIPSIGDAQVDDYAEDTAVQYRPLDQGEWQFQITEYLSSGTYITKKAEQDMFYMSQLVSSFVPKQRRAIMEHYETEVFKQPNVILGATPNDQYVINEARHKFSGGGTGGAIEVQDFAYAMYALKKANVPQTNMVAIVDPEVEYQLNTLTNLVNVSDNPRWEGIIHDGIASGMRFVKNVYGFDVWTSNYLDNTVSDSALNDREAGTPIDWSTTNGTANLFFSAAGGDINPWKSAWRQEPEVDMEWNKDYQRTEFVTTARYGVKLYRPENMVICVTPGAV